MGKLFGDSSLFLGNFTGPQETLRNKMANRVEDRDFPNSKAGAALDIYELSLCLMSSRCYFSNLQKGDPD